MQLKALNATNAYQATQKLASLSSTQKTPSTPTASFSDTLKNTITQAQKADALSTQAAMGKETSYVELVTAVSESEVAIESLLAVRDKIIQAYEEIMRTPI